MEFFALSASVTIGIILILASVSKLFNLKGFIFVIRLLNLFSRNLSILIGILVPVIELTLGLCFIFGIYIKLAAAFSFFLFIVFILLNLYAINTGKDISCNCYGKLLNTQMGIGGVLHNLILAPCSLIVLIWGDMTLFQFNAEINLIDIFIYILLPSFVLIYTCLTVYKINFTYLKGL
ncbi:hypothetical protein KD050_07785 [Psychrobacillus sp. INOP01]|uniref:MauE/DoxX family redox-associated membrane protein n=1 Tax=Psychrobacillus sp. INOP01 TaxID=2829187 RepID=UPI001BA7704D|nr:MauE/DoxX family redox-associated membrane protein [Psychrobacillus sp. INOP01]QUG43122.1 hypothetical protein KD050_07785 [Psychrobacillus sp. INOP01]